MFYLFPSEPAIATVISPFLFKDVKTASRPFCNKWGAPVSIARRAVVGRVQKDKSETRREERDIS